MWYKYATDLAGLGVLVGPEDLRGPGGIKGPEDQESQEGISRISEKSRWGRRFRQS